MAHVREKPPLRLGWRALTPAGRSYRWGDDEPDPDNIPSGVSFSTTMPGGFEQASVTLPRKPKRDYPDLERLTTLTCFGAGVDVAWEGRLERVPRVSGDQLAVTPAAVGWQAHLEDDKTATMAYVDRELARWQGPSRARRAGLLALGQTNDPSVAMDTSSGIPALEMVLHGPWATGAYCEANYDGGAGRVASVYWDRVSISDQASQPNATFNFQVGVMDDDLTTGFSGSGDQHVSAADSEATTFTATTANRWVLMQWSYAAVNGTAGEYASAVRRVAVFGNHGLTKRGNAPDQGYYASDIVGHAVGTWAPLLAAEVSDSAYVVQQAAFHEPTTAGEIVRQATRFGLQDWAVWDDKLFVWHNRGERGRQWRARIGPSQLEEAGDSVERLFNAVLVQYQDVDGTTLTAGPVGSGANTEDDALLDDDPENPANKAGVTKPALLTMGVGVSGDAVAVGTRFLEEQKQLDASGSAQLVGHIEDDHGVLHPAWRVRAGDTITLVDAADPSPRRIVRTNYDHGTRTCSIDIDAPPEGLQALLERLGADLQTVGL